MHDKVGPKPTTFSGMRALNFVLENPRVDRTLLFNVKLIQVDKSDGMGLFVVDRDIPNTMQYEIETRYSCCLCLWVMRQPLLTD